MVKTVGFDEGNADFSNVGCRVGIIEGFDKGFVVDT